MKFSKYNLIIKQGDTSILFNTLSGEIYSLDSRLESAVKNEDPNLLSAQAKEHFLRSHIILDNNYDEERVYRHIYNKQKYQSRSMTVTILLTWACNFRCVYCYEGGGEKYSDTMTVETADNVINFIINSATARGIQNLHIVLFGGEPLLNIDVGFYVLKNLKNFCTDSGKGFSCSMISNGSLLTGAILDKLTEFQCRHIQITLDGIEETHNKRRISKNGEPTFHQIVENLLLLDKYYLKIAYVIRINVDRSNVADVEPLMQELRRYGIQHAKIDFGVVRAETEACQTYESNCFNDSELGSRLDQLWRLAEKYQFSRYPGLYRRFCYCGLYCDNSYTISPKGELYKCWEMVGDLKHRIGNICSSGSVDDVSFAYYDWMTIDPLDNDDCRSCVYLPLCGGGCVMNSVKSTGSYHSSGCFKVKGVVEQQVLYLVEKKKQLSASNPITVSN